MPGAPSLPRSITGHRGPYAQCQSTHPVAENGTVPALAPNFAGPVHMAPPIPGDWRLALRVNKISVFHGEYFIKPTGLWVVPNLNKAFDINLNEQ